MGATDATTKRSKRWARERRGPLSVLLLDLAALAWCVAWRQWGLVALCAAVLPVCVMGVLRPIPGVFWYRNDTGPR